ncbi:hypothetical protein SAMN02745248_01714 [Hathewaya proteolytica DSM 3090]|uniref:Uncharacterized protein n=1 Tax=Hathewaya proteolytica DSM 3090 TaxID=1121331 RepID=A0A1M6PIH3_9CLOT|nr:hypothetical protein [Hathewaya proteolytica]SHK07745.1 hypothetical protein SAMN02745248_01714 [Hathewaya proteolytica DSM 3090]
MGCSGERMKCVCDKLRVGDCVTVVFQNCSTVSGRIVYENREKRTLVLQNKCGKCIYINVDKILYICRDCKIRPCCCHGRDEFRQDFEL